MFKPRRASPSAWSLARSSREAGAWFGGKLRRRETIGKSRRTSKAAPCLKFFFCHNYSLSDEKHSHSILCRPCVSRSFDQIYLYNILDQLNGGELIGIQMHSRHTLQPDTIHNASLKTLRTGWLIGFKAQLHPV